MGTANLGVPSSTYWAQFSRDMTFANAGLVPNLRERGVGAVPLLLRAL
jgi:hypothetical protein